MKPIYKIFFFFSIILTLASLTVTGIIWHTSRGNILGADFRGGTVWELEFTGTRPDSTAIQRDLPDVSVSPTGERGIIIRSHKMTEAQRQANAKIITDHYGAFTERRFDDIGPTVGSELKSKSITAMIVLLIVITVYLAIVFRTMRRVLSPWALGIAAILALLHDLIVPIGVISLLAYYQGIEITAVFVAAALTILGYSVSDTVVVFDRVRENVIRMGSKEPFPSIVHKSILQTLTRSINTSMTTLLALVAIFFFGGESIKYFALALIIGIISGTYSSIFVASPIIMWWHGRRKV